MEYEASSAIGGETVGVFVSTVLSRASGDVGEVLGESIGTFLPPLAPVGM